VSDVCDLLCLDLKKAERLRRSLVDEETAAGAARTFQALADPTRLTLAATLAETDELCVCDLAWIANRSQNLVSHHLRTLRAAGLAASRRDGKMVLYRLTEAGHLLVQAALDTTAVIA
jgi:DNA-binding transcriptional ArsR family regulator